MTTLIFYDENQPVALTAPELSVRDIALPSHREVGITKLEICTPSWRQKVEDVSFEQYLTAKIEATKINPLNPIIDVRPHQRPDIPALNIPTQRTLQPA